MSMAVDRAAVFEARMPACSSSSLGKDSDEGLPMGKEEEVDEGEVQSAYTEVGFTRLGALEESLPIRTRRLSSHQLSWRGISKFYDGKSRSFTFLRGAIARSGSSRDIAKAENAYTRKRKNLLAYSIMYGKSPDAVPESYERGSRKRLASCSDAARSLRPLDSSTRSSSRSSFSSEEHELHHQEFNLDQSSPDSTTNRNARMNPVCRLGSCASKTLLSTPTRSFSMLDLHRLHRSCPSVRLKDRQKVE